ncbi:chymotrypsin-2 isoform X1 [Drosophila kikkawai]|uniref:Chymotrypsin-2 isoform X1 n=1 Tax=Drosophila kikkawai TaxID=30033 RepID=A0A6P4I2G6_DROKI|nr:chymotrypsin-2 isoform X1 [Drosophila kikkawai]
MKRPNIHFWFLWLTLLRLFARADHGVITDVSDETFEFLISGGHTHNIFRWSRHVVSIRTVSYLKNPGDNHFCAGILISSRAVLTAAHCLTDRYKATLKPRGIQVVFGHFKRLDSYNVHDDSRIADRLMVHPDYERYKKNDLAIIRLNKRIPSYNPEVQPIALRKKANVTVNNTCLTMGWGQLYQHGPYSDEILYLNVILSSPSDCKREIDSFYEDDICVHPKTKGQMCAGDMGGPLICQGALAGIIAGTMGCSEGRSMKFVSFPHYRDWIQKTVNDFKNGGVTLTMDMLMLCGGWLVSQLYQLLLY